MFYDPRHSALGSCGWLGQLFLSLACCGNLRSRWRAKQALPFIRNTTWFNVVFWIRSITLTLKSCRCRALCRVSRGFVAARASVGGLRTLRFYLLVKYITPLKSLLLLLFGDFGRMGCHLLVCERDTYVTDSQLVTLQAVTLHGPHGLTRWPTLTKHEEWMLNCCLNCHLQIHKHKYFLTQD